MQMTNLDLLKSIDLKLDLMSVKIEEMAKQIESLYYDEDPPAPEEPKILSGERPSASYIMRYGVKIPYNIIDDPDEVAQFKEFIYQAKVNFRLLNEEELKWIDVADKDFSDIRLSRKHLSILQGIYPKIMNTSWPFHNKLGYMYKLGDRNKGEMEHITWQWFA
jgi:hypothetical protein